MLPHYSCVYTHTHSTTTCRCTHLPLCLLAYTVSLPVNYSGSGWGSSRGGLLFVLYEQGDNYCKPERNWNELLVNKLTKLNFKIQGTIIYAMLPHSIHIWSCFHDTHYWRFYWWVFVCKCLSRKCIGEYIGMNVWMPCIYTLNCIWIS